MDASPNHYIIATIKSWNIDQTRALVRRYPDWNIDLITSKEDFTIERVRRFRPRYIFLPHWSWHIPREIYSQFECVVFHMTDLPFGRGGSPLQNLISRGIYQTRLTALRAIEQMDAGPIYMKRDLCLDGSATEIFTRAARLVFSDMIPTIIAQQPIPQPQEGAAVVFDRRKPEQGDIGDLSSLTRVYDYIRMLDAEGYPPAFSETESLRMEYTDARMESDTVVARVKIRIKS